MADIFLVNQTPATGAIAMFNLKTELKLAGWTVPFSGDGSSLFSSSDGITTGAAGAGGMANTNAWFVLKWPGSGSKSICVQRGTTNLLWRVTYSYAAGYLIGSASATRTPTASDVKQTVIGGGTDASPTFNNFMAGTADAGFRHHIWCQSAAPYGFYSIAVVNGGATGGPLHVFALDHMLSTSYQTGDTDPYVLMCAGDTSAGSTTLTGGTGAHTSVNGALAGASGVKTAIMNSINPCNDGGIAPNPITGKDDAIDLKWFSTVAPTMNKGWSDLFYYHLTGTAAAPRHAPTAVDSVTTRDRCVFGILNVPWDGSTPTV